MLQPRLRRLLGSLLIASLGVAAPAVQADPVYVGVAPKKLSVSDKGGGSGKLVLTLADPLLGKGDGSKLSGIDATIFVAYDDALGVLEVPDGAADATIGWSVNDASGAKFQNKDAPDGGTRVKLLQVKEAASAKLVAAGTGEAGQFLDVIGEGAPGDGSVAVALCIGNGADQICHCARVQECKHKVTGSGAKLVCKGGVADETCAAIPPGGSSVECATLPAPPSGLCEVTAGDSTTLVQGDVLAPRVIYRGGGVLVGADGRIECVGCDCAAQAPAATRITCPDAVISPGLVNPHEHLAFAHNSPAADTGERYEHRHDWRHGLHGHTMIPASGGANVNQLRWGELRHLLAGTTSVVGGSNGAAGLLRNLDSVANQGGLGQEDAEYVTFPLGDAGGAQLETGCGYPAIFDDGLLPTLDSFVAHVGEGVDAFASNEFGCVSSTGGGAQDLLEPQSGFIHGMALAPEALATMAGEGAALIWSPRSNISLYGNTAEPQVMRRVGGTIALGTDWTISGSVTMLRELRCAAEFDDGYLGAVFSDRDLWQMATIAGAEVAAVDDVLGSLRVGREADIAVFAGDGYDDIVGADPQDVLLVLRGGTPLYGEAAVIAALAAGCDSLDVCGSPKRVCLQSETGTDLATLQTSVGGIYPAVFCGTPAGEPTCVPTRPVSVSGSSTYDGIGVMGDVDGDGVSDGGDNCVDVFNPIRPMDGGAQADADEDGDGDACDLCPLDEGC